MNRGNSKSTQNFAFTGI